jgi:hypothetical protein
MIVIDGSFGSAQRVDGQEVSGREVLHLVLDFLRRPAAKGMNRRLTGRQVV